MIATKRVGVFGGTFDPIHNGHIHLINEVLRSEIFSKVVIVPSGNPWQKKPHASSQERLEMAKLALEDIESADVIISDCEVARSGPSYALETIFQLQKDMTGAAFTWIIGSDAIASLKDWYRIEELASLVNFLIVVRPGFTVAQELLPEYIQWSLLEIGALDISATQIREALNRHEDVSTVVPESVVRFIKSKGLYGAA